MNISFCSVFQFCDSGKVDLKFSIPKLRVGMLYTTFSLMGGNCSMQTVCLVANAECGDDAIVRLLHLDFWTSTGDDVGEFELCFLGHCSSIGRRSSSGDNIPVIGRG